MGEARCPCRAHAPESRLNAPAPTTLLARQPLFDRARAVAAYELLYRQDDGHDAAPGVEATSRVLLEALSQIGLDTLAGPHPVLINFGEDLLSLANADLLPRDRVIVEVLETVAATPSVLAALRGLKASGVRIALDDFRWSPDVEPLLELADFVKLDVLACGDGLEDEVRRVRDRGLPWIAEKVETHEQVERCLALDCHWLQGYFLFRPEVVRGRRLESNQLMLLRLVAALQEPNANVDEIAGIVERDVALTYRVLRLASGAAQAGRAPPRTVAQAVVALGFDTLRQWSTVLALARLAPAKPPEILRTALARAHFCERIGGGDASQPPGRLFMLGLLSVLDTLLDRPMESVVAELTLPDGMRDALCGGNVPGMSDVLCAALAYERGDWAAAQRCWSATSLADAGLAYLEAVRYADRIGVAD